jgi:hypothetical protein
VIYRRSDFLFDLINTSLQRGGATKIGAKPLQRFLLARCS